MKYGALAVSIMMCLVSAAAAQVPEEPSGDSARMEFSPGEVKPTPEMWFYLQELRRYENPRLAVRKKAEFKTAQRMRRLAAQKWYGMSAARPMASPTPFTGTYSPYWAANSANPFAWRARGRTVVIAQPSAGTSHNHSRW